MAVYTENVSQMTVPVIVLHGVVAFPTIPLSFELDDEQQIAVCERAEQNSSPILLVSLKDAGDHGFEKEKLAPVGTVSHIKQFVRLPEGNARVFTEGFCRANVLRYVSVDNGIPTAEVICKTVTLADPDSVRAEALVQEIKAIFREIVKQVPQMSPDLQNAVLSLKNPGLLSDFVASNILITYEDKQLILNEYDPLVRAETLCAVMNRELLVIREEMKIRREVKAQIDDNQRDYYLREQIKAIKNELGDVDDADAEIDEYHDKVVSAKLPKEVEEKLLKEVGKLAKTPYASSESSVIRSYLDICLEIPWNTLTEEKTDLKYAKKILERDHDGLEKIKERILEYIAVRQRAPGLGNQILCLVGPPGTGKTSIGMSIARALKRKYVRVSLGGIRDEADIRGHRKTYVAAMPGRIANALSQAGTRNPVMLLDEIDKMTQDAHGDPASAMLEVLDGEQNKAFRDHFLELPIDLSDVVFICTANSLEGVPRPLIDRMEIIELHSYSRHEKLAIAKHHLIPKQLERHGLKKTELRLTESAVYELIDYYTEEAGVRNLEREIASLCRKTAKILEENPGTESVRIRAEDISSYLGCRKVLPDKIYDSDEVGVVNGLAYTELGGDMLRIEAASLPGNGKPDLTGSLGDVMKESAHIACSYIREHSSELGVDPDFYKTRDLHIHVPEGAVPKDGPSAGVTLVTALASELSGRPVRRDLAMTGEITLRGRVLAIGGLKEKTMAAYKAGVHTVCIPADNERDLKEIDPIVRDALEFIPCRRVEEVLNRALV